MTVIAVQYHVLSKDCLKAAVKNPSAQLVLTGFFVFNLININGYTENTSNKLTVIVYGCLNKKCNFKVSG